MKRTIKLTLPLLALLLTACGSAGNTTPLWEPTSTGPDPSTPINKDNPLEYGWSDRTPFEAGLVEEEAAALDLLKAASIYHINIVLSDDLNTLTGNQEVRYTNMEGDALSEIFFRLFPNISGGAAAVTELTVDGQLVDPTYELGGSAVRVPLPEDLAPGESAVFSMNFIVEIPLEMGGNYGLFGHLDDMLMLQNFYPVIPVFDDEGWNVEIPPENGDVTHFDASFYIVRLTTPAGLTVVTTGGILDRQVREDTQVIRFAAGPTRDIYIAASELFEVVSGTVGATRVNSYSIEAFEEGSRAALEHAMFALRSFNARFGTYPYTEFDLVSTPMQALGMEYPGVTAIAILLYDPQGELGGAPSNAYLESTVAHEVAHQWFFNAVGSDQVDDPWLDEAVVQYATMLYFKDTHGEDAAESFRQSFRDRWERVDQEPIPIGMPVEAYQRREYGAIVYGRGPLFIEALANELGQDAFDRFLKDYYSQFKWDIGTPEAFRDLAEKHCACDLSELFETWVFGDG